MYYPLVSLNFWIVFCRNAVSLNVTFNNKHKLLFSGFAKYRTLYAHAPIEISYVAILHLLCRAESFTGHTILRHENLVKLDNVLATSIYRAVEILASISPTDILHDYTIRVELRLLLSSFNPALTCSRK